MLVSELLKRLRELPLDTDVLVNIGGIDVDVLEIVGLDDPTESHTVALSLHPADLRDAIAALRATTK
jgi:hypothetical protein